MKSSNLFWLAFLGVSSVFANPVNNDDQIIETSMVVAESDAVVQSGSLSIEIQREQVSSDKEDKDLNKQTTPEEP